MKKLNSKDQAVNNNKIKLNITTERKKKYFI